ncbi:hypothetical protein F4779DRAFT_418561 [Xylariaceae sp. FL0662B]|nr:hypothetical protein F4779DRAFT_418561 [Xylariaceae sp. FL0662B]
MLNVIIIGGGLAGVSSAIALRRSGHNVTLLEARESFTELGAGIQMPPNATQALQNWGLMDNIKTKGIFPENMTFRSYRGESLHNVKLWPDLENSFGAPYVYIHRKEVLSILVEKASQLGAQLKLDSQIVKIDLANGAVTTARGEHFGADLIIGADGENSFCRNVLLGGSHQLQPTGKLVYRFVVEPDAVHRDAQLAQLFEPPAIHCWMGPASHAVAYEIPWNNIVNVALTCPDPVPGRVQFGPRPADLVELTSFFENWDPLFLKLINASKHRLYWTLLQSPEENRLWVDNKARRLVIVGDAAHSMTPYLGQGAAQAIEDAAFLEHLFPSSTRSDGVPGLLEVFCERRQARALPIRTRAVKVGQILQMSDGPSQQERDRQLGSNEVYEGFPIPFADPAAQRWLYDYDVKSDVQHGVKKSVNGCLD